MQNVQCLSPRKDARRERLHISAFLHFLDKNTKENVKIKKVGEILTGLSDTSNNGSRLLFSRQVSSSRFPLDLIESFLKGINFAKFHLVSRFRSNFMTLFFSTAHQLNRFIYWILVVRLIQEIKHHPFLYLLIIFFFFSTVLLNFSSVKIDHTRT